MATASTVVTQRHRPKMHVPEVLALAREVGAVGVQVAHSGTVAGLLFEPGPAAARRIESARAGLAALGVAQTWEFSTDLSSQPERFS